MSLLRRLGVEIKQLTHRHPQPEGEGANAGQGWIADAAFDTGQVRDVNAGAMCHLFLGFIASQPDLPDVTAEGQLVTHHDCEIDLKLTISTQTIDYGQSFVKARYVPGP